MKNVIKGFVRDNAGSGGVGILLLFAVVATSFLIVCEFIYAFNVKQSIDIELTRAANTAVNLAMSDEHRKDRVLELDLAAAYDSFYEYLYREMRLNSRFELIDGSGARIYALEITELDVRQSPPGIRVNAAVSVNPLFIGKLTPAIITFNVRGSSINRRIE